MAELEGALSSHELTEWMAYHEIEPFGHDVDQHMIAQLTAVTINANLKKGARRAGAADYMPKLERKTPSDERGVFAAFRAWAKSHGNTRNTSH